MKIINQIQKIIRKSPPIETLIGTCFFSFILLIVAIPSYHFSTIFLEMGNADIYNVVALLFAVISMFSFTGAISFVYLYFFSESDDVI